jgi:chromosomal replication initiator protein
MANMAEQQLTHELLWDKCLRIFRDNLNPQSFKTWFEPIKSVKLENKVLTIQVPSQFFRSRSKTGIQYYC